MLIQFDALISSHKLYSMLTLNVKSLKNESQHFKTNNVLIIKRQQKQQQQQQLQQQTNKQTNKQLLKDTDMASLNSSFCCCDIRIIYIRT